MNPVVDFEVHPGHPLVEHLESVAEMARRFSAESGSGDWGYLAGLWHDLGKFQAEFQRRLAGEKICVEHGAVAA